MGLFGRNRVKALAKAGDVEGLLDLAAAGDDGDRSDALVYLGDVVADGPRERMRSAGEAGLVATSEGVRYGAAFLLGKLGDPSAADLLLAALGDESAEVRGMAAIALGWMGPARALEPLIVLAEGDPEPMTRELATRSLAGFPGPRAVGVLRELESIDPSRDLRSAARDALHELGEQ